MENYVIKNDRTAAEMIDMYALSCCKLNDFEAFDRILFGERVQPDYNKFYVNNAMINAYDNYCYTVAVPFGNPTTMVEYQINHYVMWGVIAMLKIPHKPTELVEYNTGDYLPIIENTCWACEWSFTHSEDYCCNRCPIWYSQDGLFRFMCESSGRKERTGLNGEDLDGYHIWDDFNNDEETFEENAIKLQMYPWHVETCTDDFEF